MVAIQKVTPSPASSWRNVFRDALRFTFQTLLGSRYRRLGDSSLADSLVLFLKLSLLRIVLLTRVLVLLVALPAEFLGAPLGIIRLFSISISAIFEEQSRWIFARSHERLVRSQFVFFLLIVSVETAGYFPYGHRQAAARFFLDRIPATLFHLIACAICVLYYKTKGRWRLVLPLLVVALHAALDANAGHWMGRWAELI